MTSEKADALRYAESWPGPMAACATRQARTARATGARLAGAFEQRRSEMTEAAGSVLQQVTRMNGAHDWLAYAQDLGERSVLFLDTMRARGDQYLAYEAHGQPPLLAFEYETLVNGRDLPRPVNYFLVQIKAPPGTMTRAGAQPFVIVDPRAGHGAGIGGFKTVSEVGVALAGGHPVYFVLFSQHPVEGQTLSDVGAAEAQFLETVKARHPDSPAPCVIGNCQGGWAVMALAAARPDLMGMIVINGAPLSYWAGAEGQNPMRYSGGLLGGSWTAHLAADLGHGVFDGAHLVSNFESLNPANTYWSKYAKLFTNIDTEAPRFLEFERWWSGYIYLTRPEIETIVDDLFIGNRLTDTSVPAGARRIDLRNITAPIVVFCSQGDNITPPQQALDWIIDLYPDDAALAASGQTIVYLKHASTGHLGIFTSTGVAQLQHKEIFNAADAIMALPPGLHEMQLEVADHDSQPGVVFFRRGIDDIRSLNPDGREAEPEFAAVRQASDWNLRAYEMLLQPWVRALVNEPMANAIRASHPLRLGHRYFSSLNPCLQGIAPLAEKVRAQRHALPPEHPVHGIEAEVNRSVAGLFNNYRDWRDAASATMFHALYAPASAWFQAFQPAPAAAPASAAASATTLRQMASKGAFPAAVARIFLLAAGVRGQIDKITLERLHGACAQLPEFIEAGPDVCRRIVQEQAMLVSLDPQLARATLVDLLPEQAQRARALTSVAELSGNLGPEVREQFAQSWSELCSTLGQEVDADAAAPDASLARTAKPRAKHAGNPKVAGRA